jgi:hypothetical protein
MSAFDTWLEAPYVAAAATNDRFEAWAERMGYNLDKITDEEFEQINEEFITFEANERDDYLLDIYGE